MSEGWSDKFKERLALGGEPMFALDFVSPDLFITDPLTLERFVLHSHAGTADANHIPHAIQSVSGAGQRVNVRSWTSSMGGLRVTLAGADVAQFVSKNIPRGMMVEFKVGFAGFAFDEFETCGLFSYRNMKGSRNDWVMEFDSVFTRLQSRSDTGTPSVFYGESGQSAQVTSAFDPSTDSTLQLDNTSIFLKDGTTGARGLVYCQPSSGDPFYLKFTETSSTALDVVNVDVIDTTRTALSVGDKVVAVGYLFSVVPDVIKRLLFGGFGAGASTVITMPFTWHMNLNHDSHNFNFTDFSDWHSRFIERGFVSDFITADPIDNPFRAIEEFLSAFGAWLVIKEGALSWRFVQRIEHTGGVYRPAKYTITDEDIVAEESYQLYNPDAPIEYHSVRYPTGVYVTEGVTKTIPNAFAFESPSIGFVFNDDTRTTNQTLALENMRGRLDPWYLRIPDRMSLTLKGWRFAELVPGDVVKLESEYIYDMINASDVTHSGTQYLVTAVDVGWNDFTTRVELSTPPMREPLF